MEFLPLFLKCKGGFAVVIGGGTIALRKIRLLQRSGMRIKVIAPTLVDTLHLLGKHRTVTLIERSYKETDIADAFLLLLRPMMHSLIVTFVNIVVLAV